MKKKILQGINKKLKINILIYLKLNNFNILDQWFPTYGAPGGGGAMIQENKNK